MLLFLLLLDVISISLFKQMWSTFKLLLESVCLPSSGPSGEDTLMASLAESQ